MGNDGYTILLDMGRIETSIVNISQLGGLPCVAQSQEAVSVRDVYSGTRRECRTNPRFLAVTIGLEEIKTFLPVVIVFVKAVHRCLGCLVTWTWWSQTCTTMNTSK